MGCGAAWCSPVTKRKTFYDIINLYNILLTCTRRVTFLHRFIQGVPFSKTLGAAICEVWLCFRHFHLWQMSDILTAYIPKYSNNRHSSFPMFQHPVEAFGISPGPRPQPTLGQLWEVLVEKDLRSSCLPDISLFVSRQGTEHWFLARVTRCLAHWDNSWEIGDDLNKNNGLTRNFNHTLNKHNAHTKKPDTLSKISLRNVAFSFIQF